MPTPKFDSLPKDTQDIVHKATENDRYLYSGLAARWKKLMSQQDQWFWEEVAAFKRIQAELIGTCTMHPKQPACLWYELYDVDYFRLVDEGGYCAPVPFE